MATAGNLVVHLTTRTDKFRSGLNRAGKDLGRFRSKVDTAFSGVNLLRGAVAGIAGGAFVSLINRQLATIDALAKMSDKLGIATEDLGRLRFAGEQTGVAINTMDMALQRMTRRVAEAAVGTGEAKAAIAELGLDARKLATQSPAATFRDIAEAMKNVENPAQRLRLAFKLFDSEGVALVNTLALGSEGLDEMAKKADELGIAISRIDVAKIEAANDSWNRMKRALTGVANELTVKVAPAIEQIGRLIEEQILSKDPITLRIRIKLDPLTDPQALVDAALGRVHEPTLKESQRQAKIDEAVAKGPPELFRRNLPKDTGPVVIDKSILATAPRPDLTAGRDRGKVEAAARSRIEGIASHIQDLVRFPAEEFQRAMEGATEALNKGKIT